MKKEQSFAFIPLILGIVAILLLGGVGLEIIQTKQKISRAISEVQTLQKEKKFEEAIQKLESLENDFLIRYFGFGKDEIDRKIEENRRLIEEVEIEEDKAKIEKNKEKKEETVPEILDCQDNFDCLIEAAKNCNLAKVKDKIFVKVGSYNADILFSAEIKGKEGEKCVLHVKAEKLYKLEKEGMTEEEAEKETQKWKSFIEGAQEICKFNNEDLVKWLETLKEGILPSFESAECQYRGLEILEILPKL